MVKRPVGFAAVETDIVKHQLTDGLRQTVDRNFLRLIAAAKAEWERNHAVNDPSDACVSVRITEAPTKPAPSKVQCAGVLRKRKAVKNGIERPRLA